MTIAKVDNGGFWARHYEMKGAEPVAILHKMLNDWVLDPTFEEYGNFVTPAPVVNTRGDLIHPEAPNSFHFWGNFSEASCVFDIYTDDSALIEDLTARIRANQGTEAYGLDKQEHAKQIEETKRRLAEKARQRLAELERQLQRDLTMARLAASDRA